MAQSSFEAIGTHWDIAIQQEMTSDRERGLFLAIRERIELFESTYSRFRDGSIVENIARAGGTYTLPDDAKTMLDLYEKLYRVTGGSVTPLIGNTLVAAGYDKNYSLVKGQLHAPPRWEDILRYDFPTLQANSPTQLDFGAIGKGYLIDIVGEQLENDHIENYIVNAGGDIRQRGTAVLTVGLEHPSDKSSVIGTIEILNKSICGSAGSRRAWAGMHHIINPHTQTSPAEIVAVWAVADSTMLADAMTTALFFTDPGILMKEFSFEYCIMNADSSVRSSPKFNATFFAS